MPVQVEGRHALIVVLFSSNEGEGSAGKGCRLYRQRDGLWDYGSGVGVRLWLMMSKGGLQADANDERSLKVTKLGRSGARRRRGAGSRAKVLTDTKGRTTRDERCLGSERLVLQGRYVTLANARLPSFHAASSPCIKTCGRVILADQAHQHGH
ncbi:uncharacterized protein ARMOST_08184 [Armillaria ostoyae]|uniref:Uncharacterized protein n=1 Tax=Armillaria ostoyae TaxID=47428 RepID=A0A284R800_ARMOS|nr:uncharacterized protein ARMOST_08184 [Armillaria ostoyae]